MTDVQLNELGPVDYLVVEFPANASNFTGEMADELVALVDAGIIRVIDVLILTKNDDGTIDVLELSDVEELGALQTIEAELAELLAEDDIDGFVRFTRNAPAGLRIFPGWWPPVRLSLLLVFPFP